MEEKVFEGTAILGGDDDGCYGVHLLFKEGRKPSTENAYLYAPGTMFDSQEVIDYLDDVAKRFDGKKIRITIKVESC